MMQHPTGKTLDCPECHKPLLFNGVILYGNFLTGEPSRPVERWDCPDCEVMVAGDDVDPEWGWQQWERQNNNSGRLQE